MLYGRLKFYRKTARMHAKLCEQLLIEMSSVRDSMQDPENVRKKSSSI
jgi:hypothetical protein